MRPFRLAIATFSKLPDLSDDDRTLLPLLEREGIFGEPVLWDGPLSALEPYDGLLIRSVWDYHLSPDRFRAWLDGLSQKQHVFNPPRLMRWNMDKRYLFDLEAKGATIIPTVWIEGSHSAPALESLLAAHRWTQAVVKPAISASAHETFRVRRADDLDAEMKYRALLERVGSSGLLVQRFVPEIESSGECSLMFFGGAFSHATIKKPATGDFRTQEHLGGSTSSASPPPSLVRQARGVLDAAFECVPEKPLYARVDGVEIDGRFCLMELEVLEPFLFLRTSEGAADRFVRALVDAIR